MFLKYLTLFSGLNYLVFSSVLFLRKSPLKKANKVLGFLFAMLAVYSIMLSFYYTALLNKNYSHLIYYVPIDLIILFSLGPCLLLYIKALLGQSRRLDTLNILIQLLPFIPVLAFIVYFLLQDTPTRLNLLIENFEHGIWHTNLLNLLLYFQMTIYLIICYRTLQKQFRESSRILVGKRQIDVSWLQVFVIINLAFMTLSAPLSFYSANEKMNLIIAQLAMVVQFIYLFVKSTWQTELFTREGINEGRFKEGVLKIADDVVDQYFRVLMVYMEKEKPYLQEDCNIQIVSEQTGISVHHLSYILNQCFEKNFPDFINEFRIKEAKKLLTTNLHTKITLEAIGYDCGFGSKSCFNKAFRKYTNLTPSEYRHISKSQNRNIELQ